MTLRDNIVTPVRTSPALQSQRNRPILPFVLLSVLLCGAAWWSINREMLGFFHDDGIYTILAKALNEGKGYALINLPSAPAQFKYPVVYPYILSWVWWVNPDFPGNILLLKSVNLVFFFIYLFLCQQLYWESTKRPRVPEALCYGFLVGANPAIFSLFDYPLSEPLFLTLLLLAAVVAARDPGQPSSLHNAVLLSVIAALAYLTRTAGIVLVVAGGIHFILVSRFRTALIFFAVFLFLVFPWILWQVLHPADSQLSELLRYYTAYDYQSLVILMLWSEPVRALHELRDNLFYVVQPWDAVLLLFVFPGLRFVVYPLLLWGTYFLFRGQPVFVRVFLLSYFFLLFVWPWRGVRFYVPLLPFLFLALFIGFQEAESFVLRKNWMAKRKIAAVFVRLPLIIIVVLTSVWIASYLQPPQKGTMRMWFGHRASQEWSGFVETFTWIRENTGEEDILATAYDPMYYLYTGRRAVSPGLASPERYMTAPGETAFVAAKTPEDLRVELKNLGVHYLVIDPLGGSGQKEIATKLLDALLRSYAVEPALVFTSTNSRHRVYLLPAQ